MSLAACAAALGSLEETVWGAWALPLSMALLCSMLLGDVGLPFEMESLETAEVCEGGLGEAVVTEVLAREGSRLCVLLVVSRLSRGVCFPDAGLPVPRVFGSVSTSGSGACTEALIVAVGMPRCASLVRSFVRANVSWTRAVLNVAACEEEAGGGEDGRWEHLTHCGLRTLSWQ